MVKHMRMNWHMCGSIPWAWNSGVYTAGRLPVLRLDQGHGFLSMITAWENTHMDIVDQSPPHMLSP